MEKRKKNNGFTVNIGISVMHLQKFCDMCEFNEAEQIWKYWNLRKTFPLYNAA